jgi:L-ribulose-5-phosphate 4-epimerase
MDLPKHGLVKFTFGNASAFDKDTGVFAIKPSGVAYEELVPEMMVLVDLCGRVIDSKLRPSSDMKTHLVLYQKIPNIEGIVHTHSTYSTAWAQACKPIPCLGTTHADHAQVAIPCTDVLKDAQIQGDYETETGFQIIEKLSDKQFSKSEMILVANHGPFTWGKSADQAVYNSVVLEELAKMAFLTITINSSVPTMNGMLVNKHFNRKHGADAYYGQ